MSVALSAVLAAAPPATAGSSGQVTYEADCTTTSAAGDVAPFVLGLDVTPSVTSAAPTGAQFGASGSASLTVIGPIVAGLEGALHLATLSASVDETVSSTDGTATGSYEYTKALTAVAPAHTAVAATAASGATTLDGPFTATMINDGVSGSGIASGTAITAVNPGVSATISMATTAAVAASVSVWSSVTYTDATFATGASAFTTSGTGGGTADIGVTSLTAVTLGGFLEFGGTAGLGAANCLVTGWQDGTHPGPAQQGANEPQLPAGSTTALVTASPLVLPAAATVSLTGGSPTTTATTVGPTSTTATTVGPTSTTVAPTSTTVAPTSTTVSGGPTSTTAAPTTTVAPTTTTAAVSTTTVAPTTTAAPTTTTVAPTTVTGPGACLPYCHGDETTVIASATTVSGSGSGSANGAGTGPSIVATPATGLTDGAVVTVTGTGFPPNDALVAIECSPQAGVSSASAESECGISHANLTVTSDGSGNVDTTLTVHTGNIGSDPASVCPPASGSCFIAVSEASATSTVRAVAPIAFGSGSPGGSTSASSGGSPPAAAASGPSIVVAPATALASGQTVAVSGRGFPADDSLIVVECSPLAETASDPSSECDVPKANLSVKSDASGNINTSLTVYSGTVGADPAAVCPPTSGDCTIAVSEPSTTSSVRATANIVFASQATAAATLVRTSPLVATGSPVAASSSGGGTLPFTGTGRWTWVAVAFAIGLVDLGYLALSATWTPRHSRRAP
jgi:neocarzinostatin family protein